MSINFANFQKPSRYLGNEVNIIRKDAEVKVALCFPDTYEIGMSHLGLKILYSIINNIPYASAERVFAPWVDFESFLRQKGLFLTSLENRKPLKDFDIVGFTLQYELSYTNVLNMLDLGGIPVRSEDRGDKHPLIITGGPCTVNPLPLTPFIDAFVIGDGEEVIGEIIETFKGVRDQRSGVRDKDNLLNALAKIEGVYVPSVHSADKQKIKRRIIKNLDEAPFPEAPIVPFASIVHDRISIEILRGCTRGCRFCQAGMIYRPLRERSPENVLSLSKKTLSNTGLEEISFTSLNTGDYSNLIPLIRAFNTMCSNYCTAISLPSLRVGSVNKSLLKEIKSVRKTGFTIAPEAGTKRLRNVINKDVTEEEYEETLKNLFTEGWRSVKLYFMIGLPTETQEDINGIINMTETALRIGREVTGHRININVGISVFVPKTHTPFQWLGQTSYGELRAKQSFLRKAFKKSGINFKGQHVESSLLEAVFSKGNKDCAVLLEVAWRLGCRFDGWSEIFDFNRWQLASEKAGINLYKYASQTLDINTELPWDFIDIGITKEFLKSEYQKALDETTTPDCRHICSTCGLGCKDRGQGSGIRLLTTDNRQLTTNLSPITHSPKTTNSVKIRVKFSKTLSLRYLSHSEVITTFLRAMRRAKLPLIYSKGYHPHPKISFGPALPVGVEGISEYFDIELSVSTNPHCFALRSKAVGVNPIDQLFRINDHLPQGLEVHTGTIITKNKKSLTDFISRYEYEIMIDKTTTESINSFMSLPRYLTTRGGETVDIRPLVEKVKVNDKSLHLILTDTNGTKVRLYEILKELFQKPIEKIQAIPIKRTHLYGYTNEGWIEPSESEEKWLMK